VRAQVWVRAPRLASDRPRRVSPASAQPERLAVVLALDPELDPELDLASLASGLLLDLALGLASLVSGPLALARLVFVLAPALELLVVGLVLVLAFAQGPLVSELAPDLARLASARRPLALEPLASALARRLASERPPLLAFGLEPPVVVR
jgi:hypothetical protein